MPLYVLTILLMRNSRRRIYFSRMMSMFCQIENVGSVNISRMELQWFWTVTRMVITVGQMIVVESVETYEHSNTQVNNRSTKVVTLESREHTGGCACLEYLTIYNKEIMGHLFWALAASMLFSEHRRIVHPMSRDNSVNCGDESVPKRGRKIDVCDAGP